MRRRLLRWRLRRRRLWLRALDSIRIVMSVILRPVLGRRISRDMSNLIALNWLFGPGFSPKCQDIGWTTYIFRQILRPKPASGRQVTKNGIVEVFSFGKTVSKAVEERGLQPCGHRSRNTLKSASAGFKPADADLRSH